MDDKMGPGEVKLLSVMSGADSAESIKLKDAEHLAEMVEEMGPVVSAREEGEIRKMVSQVWSLTQFYSVDFSNSTIDVKKCVFNKRTIKVCVSCC